MIQNNLEFSANLIIIEYLMLLMIHMILKTLQTLLLIMINDKSTFSAVLDCSKEQAAIEFSKWYIS